LPIPGYELPVATNIFAIDEETGQIFWDSPYIQGEYVIAVRIIDWRNGNIIGGVLREFQFRVDAFYEGTIILDCPSDTNIFYEQQLDLSYLIWKLLQHPIRQS